MYYLFLRKSYFLNKKKNKVIKIKYMRKKLYYFSIIFYPKYIHFFHKID